MKIYIIFLTAFLISCTNKVIYYNYNGTTVTRVDKDGEIRLYYGDLKDNQNKHPYIKAEYSGFNSGVDALLRFNTDTTVEVIRYGGGYFTQSKDAGKEIYMKEYENPALDSIVKFYDKNYLNLMRVSDVIDYEKKWNFENNSKVTANYP